MTAMVVAGSLTSTGITEALGSRRALATAFLGYADGAAGLLLAGLRAPYGYVLPALLAIGFAAGFIPPAATAPALGTVEKARIGTASGVLNANRQAGAAIGVAGLGALIATTPTPEPGLGPALRLIVLVSVVSAWVCWRMGGEQAVAIRLARAAKLLWFRS